MHCIQLFAGSADFSICKYEFPLKDPHYCANKMGANLFPVRRLFRGIRF